MLYFSLVTTLYLALDKLTLDLVQCHSYRRRCSNSPCKIAVNGWKFCQKNTWFCHHKSSWKCPQVSFLKKILCGVTQTAVGRVAALLVCNYAVPPPDWKLG